MRLLVVERQLTVSSVLGDVGARLLEGGILVAVRLFLLALLVEVFLRAWHGSAP